VAVVVEVKVTTFLLTKVVAVVAVQAVAMDILHLVAVVLHLKWEAL
jgi:hypothetical protein